MEMRNDSVIVLPRPLGGSLNLYYPTTCIRVLHICILIFNLGTTSSNRIRSECSLQLVTLVPNNSRSLIVGGMLIFMQSKYIKIHIFLSQMLCLLFFCHRKYNVLTFANKISIFIVEILFYYFIEAFFSGDQYCEFLFYFIMISTFPIEKMQMSSCILSDTWQRQTGMMCACE